MSNSEIKEKLINVLSEIALDEDTSNLNHSEPLSDQLDLDSMDFLDVVMEVKKNFKVVIPQEDFTKVKSLDELSQYIDNKCQRQLNLSRHNNHGPC